MGDVLLLNFSYEALNTVTIERAVRLLFTGKAEIVHGLDRPMRSASFEMRMPSIVRLLYFIKRPMQRVGLTKKNVLLRDSYRCQYCGVRGSSALTVDHVVPKSRGGASSWENLVAACSPCNSRKNDRTPKEAAMKLLRQPKRPRYIPWIRIKKHTLPAEWGKYLFLYDVSVYERVE